MVGDAAEKFGCQVYWTKVGEINVVEKMLEVRSPIGGEGNGGVIALGINPCRDSFVGMAMVLESLAEEGGTLSELRAMLPTYAMVKEKVACRSRDVAPFLRLLQRLHRGQPMNLTDGVKVQWPDRWLHVRGSNTEPVLRIIAEAPRESEARELVLGVLEYLRRT
jgi:phosphomannomutase